MDMSSEEAKILYNNIDFKSMNERVVISMMEIVQLPSPDEAHTLFHKVLERFTKDELAFLACTHIAESFKDILSRMNQAKANPQMGASFDDFFKNFFKK